MVVWPPGLCYLLREAKTVSISGRDAIVRGRFQMRNPTLLISHRAVIFHYPRVSSSNEAHPVSPNYHRSSNIADTQYLGSINFYTGYVA